MQAFKLVAIEYAIVFQMNFNLHDLLDLIPFPLEEIGAADKSPKKFSVLG